MIRNTLVTLVRNTLITLNREGMPVSPSEQMSASILIEINLLTINPFGWEGIRAKDEIRTRDPDLGKVVLYQLSYFRIELHNTKKPIRACIGFVLRAGIEPALRLREQDFKSCVSTSSTI